MPKLGLKIVTHDTVGYGVPTGLCTSTATFLERVL